MAQLSPSLNLIRQDAGLFRELDVLERLCDSLVDGNEIFHGVDWHSVHGGMDLDQAGFELNNQSETKAKVTV